MVRKFITSVVLILFVTLFITLITSSVIAYTTEITVSTLANHDVEIKVLNPLSDENNLLGVFNENSGGSGKVSFNHTSDKSRISLAIMIRKDGKFVEINNEIIHKTEKQNAGTPININLVPNTEQETTEENTTQEVNETEETNITEATIIEETQQGGITGEAISEESSFNITNFNIKEIFSSTLFYIFGAIILVLIAVFVVFKTGLIKPRPPKNIKTKKYSELKEEIDKQRTEIIKKDEAEETETESFSGISDDEISVAERKLQEAQTEINRLKKIQEAEKKVREYQAELNKLRKP